MSYIVVDLPCDPVPFPECSGIDFIVLLFHQCTVLFREEQITLCAVIHCTSQCILQAVPLS